MSMTAMVEETILRRERPALEARLKPKVHAMAESFSARFNIQAAQREEFERELLPVASLPPKEQGRVANMLEALIEYIPTESIALYLAATSAMKAIQATFPIVTPERLYWSFAGVTLVLFILIYLGKRRAAGITPLCPGIRTWPWWKMIAAIIAFLAWALTIPATPYFNDVNGGAVATLIAISVSTLLSLLDRVIEPPESSA